MIDPEFIKAFAGAALFVLSLIIAWVKSGASVQEKITRKRSEENAKASITAKEKLIEVVAADDDEYIRKLRASERRRPSRV